MKASCALICCLASMLGCADLGTGSQGRWILYDLPNGHISLPPELIQVPSVGRPPVNPEFAGVVDNQPVRVQFCLYDTLWRIGSADYQEQWITLHGCRAVLFRCLGIFHPYNSHFSKIIGMKAYFTRDAEPVVVMVEIQNAEADDLARSILFTMGP